VELLGLAVVLFASTNVDDIFVLVGFFADPKFRARNVVVGQYAGTSMLFGLSLLGSLLSLVISRAYIGLLGIFAIGLGSKKLFDLTRNQVKMEAGLTSQDGGKTHAQAATVALVTLANGGDNVGVYTPAFAVHSNRQLVIVGLVFAVMTALWCLFAHWLVHHPTLGTPIRRYGDQIAPLVLIALGLWVMYDAGSFALLYQHGIKRHAVIHNMLQHIDRARAAST
jgi:cadmium resistance protein CadD (predicted permease)